MPIQQTELHQLIKVWRKANPRQRFVSGVHFDEVAILRGKNSISLTLSDSSDLLAPIDRAAQEAEDIRLLAERGVFLMERLPQLLMAQARYVIHEEVAPEQIDNLVKDFSEISGSMVEAQKLVAGFPQLLTQERKAWLMNGINGRIHSLHCWHARPRYLTPEKARALMSDLRWHSLRR